MEAMYNPILVLNIFLFLTSIGMDKMLINLLLWLVFNKGTSQSIDYYLVSFFIKDEISFAT